MSRKLTRRSFVTLSGSALAALGLSPATALAEGEETDSTESVDVAGSDSIAIVHTNDVHCAVQDDDGLDYASLVDYVKSAKSTYGEDNVTLVDAGDAIQGDAIGTLSEGTYLVSIMDQCGYDFAVPGNHEFDYGMNEFLDMADSAKAQYLSCNFTYNDTLVFSPCEVVEYTTAVGSTFKVGYVGICTPETLTKSSPVYFQDDSGNYVYSFCEDSTGEELYDAVQSAVDTARGAGADYVIAIGHLGQEGITSRWSSASVVANTTGIDVFIDGHSHETYVQEATNKNGESVIITQTGTKFANLGVVIINPDDDSLEAVILDENNVPKAGAKLISSWDGSDTETDAYVDTLMAQVSEITSEVVGDTNVKLVAYEDDGSWAVRKRETNLGDFAADAYLATAKNAGYEADIAVVNGGGLRADLSYDAETDGATADVTYGNLISIHPYNNQLGVVTTAGQNILDLLEMGAMKLPETSGGFQQVAGISFTIDSSIDSSVTGDEQGNFVSVDGEYRVRDVKVGSEDLDVNKDYSLVSHTYLLSEGGDGLNMFLDSEASLICLDVEALIDYVEVDLGTHITADQYGNESGEGRITIVDGSEENKGDDAVIYEVTEGSGATWTTGSSAGLVFTIDADVDKFQYVEINGTLLSSTNYTVSSGGTIVTLSSEYLSTLSAGEYTLTAFFSDGEASATFTIQEEAASSGTGTGDGSDATSGSGTIPSTTKQATPATGDATSSAAAVIGAVGLAGIVAAAAMNATDEE